LSAALEFDVRLVLRPQISEDNNRILQNIQLSPKQYSKKNGTTKARGKQGFNAKQPWQTLNNYRTQHNR
jgi:hypothetical protein